MFLEISQNSQENPCARVSFLIKLQASGLQLYYKRDSGTGIFTWLLWNFKEHLFYRIPLDDYSQNIHRLTENNQGVGHISIFVVSTLKMSVCGTIANYFLKFRKVIECHRKSSKFLNYYLLRNSISCPATNHVCRLFHK